MEDMVLEKSKKILENSKMSELVFASRMMRDVIAPPGSADSKSERIRRAARLLKWKYSRAFSVWYGDERVSIKPHELRQIEETSGVEYARKEVHANDEIIERASAILGEAADKDSPFVVALRSLISAFDRAGTPR